MALINSVLDSQLVYVMSALQVPPDVIKQIDKRRRAFLWAGNKDTSSAKCLVAWQNVCTIKDLGGLGIKDFGTKNICLLLNLLHRLHCADTLQGDLAGNHWDMLRSLLPLYQAITTVQLGDGHSTLFWTDVWIGDDAFANRFPSLFSRCTMKDATVHQAVTSDLHRAFVTRLSTQAQQEIQQLRVLTSQTANTRLTSTLVCLFCDE
jgi:hypothetical protein